MAQRFWQSGKEKLVVLILTDFDPEGEDIAHSLHQVRTTGAPAFLPRAYKEIEKARLAHVSPGFLKKEKGTQV